jgi:hypothetical protein
MKYGILKTSTNTGQDSELQTVFVAPLSITSNQPAYVQDMLSLRRVTGSQNVQRWEIEANVHPENGTTGFLVHSVKNGAYTPIYVRMPQVPNLTTSADGIVVNGTASIGASTLNITGASAMVPGEFIKFANHSKVYMVTDAGAASANVGIAPPLVSALTNGVAIKTGGNVTLTALYEKDVALGIKFTDGILSDNGSVKLVEAL